MSIRRHLHEEGVLLAGLVRWSAIGTCVGILAGVASAGFLLGLDWATQTRIQYPRLLWLLPAAGVVIAWLYGRFGKGVEGGNNLILERIQRPGERIPLRMAPLIAVTTILTHFFGGSAGREGTAVQMGGSLANLLSGPLRLSGEDRRSLLMAGVSGGFGAVFGTPLAGTIFGLEVHAVGRIRYDALVPCFLASVVGDLVCRGLGIDHHLYHVDVDFTMTPALMVIVAVAGLCFGAASYLFSELTDAIAHAFRRARVTPLVRPLIGGLAIIGLTHLVGTRDYLGLGLPLIERSFTGDGVASSAFALKILFTAVTLGSGFKGGEVTPLFCIGATLGSAFASWTGQPPAVFAALGFVAVFAGAANTPLACVLMGIELFGANLAAPLTLACVVSYIVTGHRGIYLSQQVDTPKAGKLRVAEGVALRETRAGAFEVISSPGPAVARPSDVDRLLPESETP